MKTLSEILIKVDKDPTPANRRFAWDQLMENKKKYPLAQLWFAKEYLGVITLGIDEWYAAINRLGVAKVNANKAAEGLRDAIESCMSNDKKDSFLVKIVKKLNRILNWFYKNIKIL